MTEAMNSAMMEFSVSTPYRMRITDGGMMMPSVPPAAMTPLASDLE